MKRYFYQYLELGVWVSALVSLALMDPTSPSHYSLCFFKWVGFSFCPGCGLGHSISWIFHGELTESLKSHPLGIMAIPILIHRIYILFKKGSPFITA